MTSNEPLPTLEFPRPLVTVDVVIFSVIDNALKVVLVKRPGNRSEPFPNRWALPGGFIDINKDASLLDCALRKLREKTGVETSYLEQLGCWGGSQRDPRGWSVTNAFFALMPGPELALMKGANAAHVEWIDAEDALRKRMAFDHNEILASAHARLRSKVEYTSLPAFLLDEPFTLPQLQSTYEIVLGRPVDKSAFRKRMLDGGFLAEAGMMSGGMGRPAMGYRLVDRSHATLFPRTFCPRDSPPEPK
ncbi:NUDIX domain-containing protein [Acidovorax sp.]|uniref:NUDIX hydrolase n=1 Tax=Acidovorax sp. TaxID=1872122 RepID=UPI00261804DE|nr:NUDIX domain-containing protein [Acidovorax sp.]